ncbi:MAG: nitrous oxide reductase family maturation protein NosD [Planctomycetota bacterium]
MAAGALPLLLLLLLGVPRCAPGAVHTVGEGGSISAALRAAGPGDTILLTGREYAESLLIDVPVTLTGDGRPVIRGGYSGHVIHITAPGTILEGLHVREAGESLSRDLACILVEADSVTIRDCLITESLHGIYVKGGKGTRITGNRIEGRLDLIEADRGNGIHLWNTSGNRVADNEILNVRDGIYFSFAHATEIERNHIHHVRYGLHYMYSNDNSFTDNFFESNVAGAALMYSENIVFSRNIFARCRGFRAYGILLQSMTKVVARSNLILDNSRGVFLSNSDENLLEHNDVADNDLAVQLNGSCDGNRFLGNNFINNLSELLLDVSDRETAWADEGGGNHWSGYRGHDLDRDGIGDRPFLIQNVFQVMESDAPEVRFYLLSPAAEVLKAAERALPILRLGDAEDPRPFLRPVLNRDVPWGKIEGIGNEPSLTWAALYLFGTLIPTGALLCLSRAGRRRQAGQLAHPTSGPPGQRNAA